MQAWEIAHGHDLRLKCYPEFGCLVLEGLTEAVLDAAQKVLEGASRERHALSLVHDADLDALRAALRALGREE